MDTALPISRVRMIMKSSLDTGKITSDVLFTVAKSTELFIQHLAKGSFKKAKDNHSLKYEELAQFVQNADNLEFLLQIVPQKIKVKDFRAMKHKNDSESSVTDSDEDE